MTCYARSTRVAMGTRLAGVEARIADLHTIAARLALPANARKAASQRRPS